MDVLYAAFDYIREWIIVIYSLSLIIAVCKFKEMNSTVITIALLLCLECLSDYVEAPLLSVGSWEAWYGGWIALDVLMIFALYEAHRFLQINLAKISNTVVLAQICTSSVQAYRYIERSFFDGQQFDAWYYLAINSINISIAIIVVLTLIKQREEKHVGLYI